MAPHPLPTFHVFVSSTWVDLQPERQAVEDSLQRVREVRFIGMEYFGSHDETTKKVSILEIEQCQLYLGIIGGRYGSGITEAEYHRARDLGLPCFIYIKPDESVPMEGRDEEPGKAEKLAAFTVNLRKTHDVSTFASPDDLAAKVTADLHRWLMQAHFKSEVDAAASNELPPEVVQALLSAVADVGALVQELREQARRSGVAHPEGQRLVPAASNTGVVNTGDIVFKIFSNGATPLAQHIRVEQFRSLIEERTRHFVGRGFVFAAITKWISDPGFSSGYITIQGEPGIGKTTIASELVKRRGYVHHFNVAKQNIRSIGDFLANVCAQLILRYRLGHSGLPEKATTDSGFLEQLLREAAERRLGTPVVIVLDALDEADHSALTPKANSLWLPPSLPAGVFFIITTREKSDYRLVVDRREEIYLSEDDPLNKDDIDKYVENFIEQHRVEMLTRIQEWEVEVPEFRAIITGNAKGNFMYIVYVLNDIWRGQIKKQSLAELRDLPKGLKEYYRQHWRQMSAVDPGRFDDYYKPVLCLLATAAQPVGIAQLANWCTQERGEKADPFRVKQVVDDWREFLNIERGKRGEPLYRLYHTSFQDFLREEVGLERYESAIAQTDLDRIPGWPRN
jgi:hypothetical protein